MAEGGFCNLIGGYHHHPITFATTLELPEFEKPVSIFLKEPHVNGHESFEEANVKVHTFCGKVRYFPFNMFFVTKIDKGMLT